MLVLARKIALARVHACRAKRLLPGHDGRVPFLLFPSIATYQLARLNPTPCGIFLPCGVGVLSMPELLRRLALAVRCGALAHAVRCLSSGSSREKMAFPPPGLLSSRCSYG
jgi:hypothetical protein